MSANTILARLFYLRTRNIADNVPVQLQIVAMEIAGIFQAWVLFEWAKLWNSNMQCVCVQRESHYEN
jgi:hypothetical protein